jgi:hypothetical protein
MSNTSRSNHSPAPWTSSQRSTGLAQLAGFGEDFRTRGGLEISTCGAGQQVGAAISVGRRARVTVLGQWADLGKLKDLVVQAKTTLDSVKK